MLINLSLTFEYDGQFAKKCSKVSAPSLHNGQVEIIWPLENFERWCCRMYVSSNILALKQALLMHIGSVPADVQRMWATPSLQFSTFRNLSVDLDLASVLILLNQCPSTAFFTHFFQRGFDSGWRRTSAAHGNVYCLRSLSVLMNQLFEFFAFVAICRFAMSFSTESLRAMVPNVVRIF